MINFNQKQIDFINFDSNIDFLEGTIRSGKSVCGIHKFILNCYKSKEKQFMMCAMTTSIAKRNFIDNEFGIINQFGDFIVEGKDKSKGIHYLLKTKTGTKIIYIVGLDNIRSWKRILGSTLGGVFIDEINVCDIQAVNEILGRMISVDKWFLICTANPDNPSKDIYKILNKCRPLKKYSSQIPIEIKNEYNKVKKEDKYIYWYFDFYDNPAMDETKIKRAKEMYPEGSVYYNTKIKGIRGVATGNPFINAINSANLFEYKNYNELNLQYITIGLDIGSNKESEIKQLGAKSVLTLTGFDWNFNAYVLDAYECKSNETNDLIEEIIVNILKWMKKFHIGLFQGIYIDGFGALELVKNTLSKRLYELGININVNLAFKFGEQGGIKEREELLVMMLHNKKIKFDLNNDRCMQLLEYLKVLCYNDKGFIEDKNDVWNDWYDSLCYSITCFSFMLWEELR